jgi:8-oxo-dGTP diphosphatase
MRPVQPSPPPARPAFPVRAHIILRAGDRLVLTLRAATLPGGGWWQLPGGHLEPGETLPECAIREAREEVGVLIAREDLRFVHVSHVLTRTGATRLALFFEATRWRGTPANHEPVFCDDLGFFPLGQLPAPIVPYIAHAISSYLRREPFSVVGRPRPGTPGNPPDARHTRPGPAGSLPQSGSPGHS